MLDTQTVIVLCVLFCKQIHVSTFQSIVSVKVRSQYSSGTMPTNDLNVAVTFMTWVHSFQFRR